MDFSVPDTFSAQNFVMQTPSPFQTPELGQPIEQQSTEPNSQWYRKISADKVNAEENHGYHTVYRDLTQYLKRQDNVEKMQAREQTVGVHMDGYFAKVRWHTDVEERFVYPSGSPQATSFPEGQKILHERFDNEIIIDLKPLLERSGLAVPRGFFQAKQQPSGMAIPNGIPRPPSQPQRYPQIKQEPHGDGDGDSLFIPEEGMPPRQQQQQQQPGYGHGYGYGHGHGEGSSRNPVMVEDAHMARKLRDSEKQVRAMQRLIDDLMKADGNGNGSGHGNGGRHHSNDESRRDGRPHGSGGSGGSVTGWF